jgi:hypothetical protein
MGKDDLLCLRQHFFERHCGRIQNDSIISRP